MSLASCEHTFVGRQIQSQASNFISSSYPSKRLSGYKILFGFFIIPVSFNLECKDGVSTVPGQIALHLIPSLTYSTATDLVKPITPALVVPYINRLGAPIIDETTEDILIIDPPPF